MSEPARLALDTTVLLALADKNTAALEAIRRLRERIPECTFLVTPAPISELVYCLEQIADATQAGLARKALQAVRSDWGFQEVGPSAFKRTVVERHVQALFARRLLRPGCATAAETAIEAALQGCRLLLSWDEDLVSMPAKKFRAALLELELPPLNVMTPLEINRQ